MFRLALRLNSLIFLFLSRLTFQYFFKGYMPMAKVIGQRGSECLFGGDKAQGPRDAENWGEGKKTARHRRTSTADGRAPRGRGTHGAPGGRPRRREPGVPVRVWAACLLAEVCPHPAVRTDGGVRGRFLVRGVSCRVRGSQARPHAASDGSQVSPPFSLADSLTHWAKSTRGRPLSSRCGSETFRLSFPPAGKEG